MRKTRWGIGFTYWFVHFTVEVICFYTIYRLFNAGNFWWATALVYDILAFAPQAVIGDFCEKHPKFRPGRFGFILLIAGAGVMLITAATLMKGTYPITRALLQELILQPGMRITFGALEIAGLTALTIGNAFIHIDGAMATLRVSEGRLAESAIFVGGGSFGVITGRLLSTADGVMWIPFVLAIFGMVADELARANILNRYEESAFDFEQNPCRQSIAAERLKEMAVIILGLVVVARAYIGYGLPTAWNQSAIQTFFLFVFMGTGKMLGGILADRLGPRTVGAGSCLLAVPLLLVSNNIMWLSLIAVALFSMTMAITLGGLVSILPRNPGMAFGITTIGLLIGTIPPFFFGIPKQSVCNVLIVIISVLAAWGIWYCLKPDRELDLKIEQEKK